MEWDRESSPAQLEALLEAGQVEAARELIGAFHADIRDTGRAVAGDEKRILTTLRAYTRFDELAETAACIKEFAPGDPETRVLHAQAMIELGRMSDAITDLLDLRVELDEWVEGDDRPRKATAQEQLPEVEGLLGRAYKQLYVDARPTKAVPREHDHARAIGFYRDAFNENPAQNFWHAVNWIALLTHAERVAQDNTRALSHEAGPIATELLGYLADKRGYWARASEIEAHLATGDTDLAIEACKRCLALSGESDGDRPPELTRFQLNSTIRQLEELWMLDEQSAPGKHILTPMRARMAQLAGGRMVIDATSYPQQVAAQRDELQRVWGNTSYKPIEWLEQALERARAVARIGINAFSGHGTGFLVDGGWFGGDLVGRPLLLTNAHVCSPDRTVQDLFRALDPDDAVVSFIASEDAEPIRGSVLFTSAPDKLDATLLELERLPDGIAAPALAPQLGGEFVVGSGDRVNIIGHPHGAGMQVSIQDNQVKEIGERYLWYQTPTDPGSSGSPVFDQDWQVVGLHHSAKGTKMANEGVRIDRIIQAVQDSRPPTPGPTVGTVATDKNPWDIAHEQLDAFEAREGMSLESGVDVDFAPDLVQRLEAPTDQLEGAGGQSPMGLNTFWPPEDADYTFAWHLGDGYSQLRLAREQVGDPGNDRIRIGILDTGYDDDHITKPAHVRVDLARNLTGDGDENDAVDRTDSGFLHNPGHGTATLALLAGAEVDHPDLPNARDWLGGAPHFEVVPIRIADSVVHFSGDAIARGIEYALDVGCRVISISMGGVPNKRWARAVNRAYEAGVVIVAAAGNRFGPSPPTTMVYPARFHRVIAACGATHDKTPYYEDGLHREMQGCFGPDGRMTSAIAAFTPNMPWAKFGTGDQISLAGGGTSCATPQVAAAAALWLQHHYPVLPDDDRWRVVEAARHALFTSAAGGRTDEFGAGLLRANDALAIAPPADLEQSPKANVRFKWLRLLFGLEAAAEVTNPREEMFENEALQLYLLSNEFQELLDRADPDDETVDLAKVRELFERMSRDPHTSDALKRRLEAVLRFGQPAE